MINNDDPVEELKNFMTCMKDWEDEFFSIQQAEMSEGIYESESWAIFKEKLCAIFDKFLIDGKKNRNRLESLACGNPSRYNPESDVIAIENKTATSAVISVTQASGLESVFRISLKYTKNRWVIKKIHLLNYDDSWSAIGL